jgi:opacity protein-like surface antigen
MRKIALVIGIALTLAAGAASAQALRNEISAFGTWNSLSGDSGTRNHDWDVSYLQLNYARYFSENVAAIIGYSKLSKMGDKNYDILEVGGKLSLGNVRQGAFVPYAEAALGLFDFNGNDLGLRLGIGASYMVTDSTSIDPHFSYLTTLSGDKLKGHILGLRIATRF